MAATSSGQVRGDAAEVYERFFVPAMFREAAGQVLAAVGVPAGSDVLDVACGTGVLARAAAQHTAPERVTGLDRNEGMLEVARRVAPAIQWRAGTAEALPFPDASFDRAFCLFGVMFFDDRPAAMRELRRVLRAGGKAAIAVWASLDRSPGYAGMVRLLERLFGADVADELRAPFALGSPRDLEQLLANAGARATRIETLPVVAHFPSLEAWVRTDIEGWTLAGRLDQAQCSALLEAARVDLRDFVLPDGRVAFDDPALLAVIE
jgi:SAM-dependent methyltransferase